ncbi:metal-dependent hydrolase [Candidatus Parcubacteria bacterium]|nr:metal-dependent hydrolase [Candidatus Parcubacteria bacterium]
MTPAGHLAGGYLVATALTALVPETRPFSQWLIAATMLGSVFPDIDLVYHLWKQQSIRMEYGAIYHRAYPTHAPVLYAAAAGVALSPLSPLYVGIWAPFAFFIGVLIHFVQDSFGAGPGIRWLWPWRKKFLRAPTVYRSDGSFKRNVFMRPNQYLRHWLCWIEAALVVVAIFIGR